MYKFCATIGTNSEPFAPGLSVCMCCTTCVILEINEKRMSCSRLAWGCSAKEYFREKKTFCILLSTWSVEITVTEIYLGLSVLLDCL
jgi:hypothetical protein